MSYTFLNEIDLVGSQSLIESIVNRFETYIEPQIERDPWGRATYKSNETGYYGYWDDVKNEFFLEAHDETLDEIPKEYELKKTEAIWQFISSDSTIQFALQILSFDKFIHTVFDSL